MLCASFVCVCVCVCVCVVVVVVEKSLELGRKNRAG